jgi:predicted DCC family thiol-disulfide oxidoreductase YuxK
MTSLGNVFWDGNCEWCAYWTLMVAEVDWESGDLSNYSMQFTNLGDFRQAIQSL